MLAGKKLGERLAVHWSQVEGCDVFGFLHFENYLEAAKPFPRDQAGLGFLLAFSDGLVYLSPGQFQLQLVPALCDRE